jgi:hypothetical protein
MLGHEEAVIPSLPDSFQESEKGALLRKETSKKKVAGIIIQCLLLTSCSTSMKDLAALFSKAFPCLVLRFIFLDCFFCKRTADKQVDGY